MRRSQYGLSFFGALVILAIAAVAAYYLYQALATESGGEAPSCNAALTACLQKCRRTATEAPAAQKCQQGCQRDADACERRDR